MKDKPTVWFGCNVGYERQTHRMAGFGVGHEGQVQHMTT